MYAKLIDEWAESEGFQAFQADHATVLRNLTKWLDRHAKQYLIQIEKEMNFKQWWRERGSGWRIAAGDDCEEHARKVAALAWDAARAAEQERCARIAEGVERTEERHWVPDSLYDTLRRETAAEIRRKR